MSVDCLISFKLRYSWILVWWVVFLWKPGYFWYCVSSLWALLSVYRASSDITLSGEGVGATSLLQGEGGGSGSPLGLPWQHPSRKGEGGRRLHTQSSPNPQMEGSHYHQQGWKSLLGPSLPPSQRRGPEGSASLQPSRLFTQPLLEGGGGTAVFSAVFGRNLAIIV